jgi:hypothetical protein
MGAKLSKLATRFKKAIKKEQEARLKAEEARKAWQKAAVHERTEFLAELAEFGRKIGVLEVKRRGTTLLFGYRSRSLEFREALEGNRILLEYAAAEGEEAVVLTEDGDWLLELAGSSMPFIPDGLEELMVVALDLPPPGGAKATPKKPAPAPPAKKAAPAPPAKKAEKKTADTPAGAPPSSVGAALEGTSLQRTCIPGR